MSATARKQPQQQELLQEYKQNYNVSVCVCVRRLQTEYDQCKSELSVALETERKTTSDLTERLQEAEKRLEDTRALLQQLRDALHQHNNNNNHNNNSDSRAAAVHDGNQSVLQLLKETLGREQLRRDETDKQVDAGLSFPLIAALLWLLLS